MVTFAKWAGVFKRQSEEDSSLCRRTISPELVQSACAAAGHRWRKCFWTPVRTVWTFLLQVLHPDCSCRGAVAMALAEEAASGGQTDRSADPSAYSQARGRLPLAVLRHCLEAVGRGVRESVHESHLWFGRRVWLVDGTRCSMPG